MHLSGNCPGQVPPRANFRGFKRCAAPAKARNRSARLASLPLPLSTRTRPLDRGRCLQPRRHRRQKPPTASARWAACSLPSPPAPSPALLAALADSRASDQGTPQSPNFESAHSHSHLYYMLTRPHSCSCPCDCDRTAPASSLSHTQLIRPRSHCPRRSYHCRRADMTPRRGSLTRGPEGSCGRCGPLHACASGRRWRGRLGQHRMGGARGKHRPPPRT